MRRQRGRLKSGADGHEVAQMTGNRRQRGGHQPGIFAAFPRGDQYAVIAETIRRQRHLLQIREIHRTTAFGGAQIPPVTVGG